MKLLVLVNESKSSLTDTILPLFLTSFGRKTPIGVSLTSSPEEITRNIDSNTTFTMVSISFKDNETIPSFEQRVFSIMSFAYWWKILLSMAHLRTTHKFENVVGSLF